MSTQRDYERLSDRVLAALTVALEQKDIAISDLLRRALEMSMTRGAGGKDFTERREFADEVEKALTTLDKLHKAAKA
jgi:hypothetical protein